MGDTNIEWTDRVWNPIRGCSKVSAGCARCYAEVMAARFARQWGTPEIVRPDGGWSGVLSLVESKLTEPLRWRAPQKVFVNSMSDLFHEKVPDEWIDRIFAVMALSPRHTFQVLTKRPERMRAYLAGGAELGPQRTERRIINRMDQPDWIALPCGRSFVRRPAAWPLPNVWIGVSVEDQATADARIPLLLQTPAAVRFVSYEPALGPVDFTRCLPGPGPAERASALQRWTNGAGSTGLDQVIVGGESGPGARPCDVQWIRCTRDQCRAAGVAVFVKQFGARPYIDAPTPAGSTGRMPCLKGGSPDEGRFGRDYLVLRDRKGGDMEEWSPDLRVREFPNTVGRVV